MYCMQPDSPTVVEVPCDQPGALVVMTQAELQQSGPLNLSPESGAAIGGAVLLVMAVAWVLRAARKTLEESEVV